MTRHHRLLGRLLLIGGLLLLPGAAGAQELYTYSVSLLGGIGGSFDANPGGSLTNSSFQLNLGMVTEPHTQLVLRAGKLALDKDNPFTTLLDADLQYLTIGGEYRARQGVLDSGLYLALGGYRLNGTQIAGRDERETSVGVAVGATGELPLTRHVGILAEFSGHYVNFREVQFFGMAHAGVSIHF
ncbi:MAG TPA: hypothetical protein VF173_22615 [Thermoanaerobaculia bacterium]|nr:hypothetical protein [Thermoanaerobaculia bacterium]